MPIESSPPQAGREWSVLWPNGARGVCVSEEEARLIEQISSAKAQWRTTWADAEPPPDAPKVETYKTAVGDG